MFPNPWDGRRILVVDDEAFSREMVTRQLRALGRVKVDVAVDGLEALDVLMSGGIDALIIDFMMPNATGLDVIKAVRCGDGGLNGALPCVLLTGLSDRHLLNAAIRLEVDAFLIKPATAETLAQRLNGVFAAPRPHSASTTFREVEIDPAITDDRASALPPPPHAELVALAECPAGVALARNLLTPNGALLLARGTVLTDRLLARLSELQPMDETLDQIWIVR